MQFDEYGIMSLRFSVANLAIATLVISINKFVIIATLVASTNKFVILRTLCVRENLNHLKCPLCKLRLPTVYRVGDCVPKYLLIVRLNLTQAKKVLTKRLSYYIL